MPRSVHTSRHFMIPVIAFHSEITYFIKSEEYRCCLDCDGRFDSHYELALVEEADLPAVAHFIVQSFGADVILLSTELSKLEKFIVTPAIELVNGYSGIVAFAEVLAGMRKRLSSRLSSTMRQKTVDDFAKHTIDMSPPNICDLSPDDKLACVAGSSIVLALAKIGPGGDNADASNGRSEPIASIELRLQPCDAKIPFTLPWIDRIERNIARFVGFNTKETQDLQPYLSNLCVDTTYRGRGIGRALVRCVEDIAVSHWGHSKMYLHVDPDNEPAMKLYESEGYVDVGRRWDPFWAGRAASIGYFVKDLPAMTFDEEVHLSKMKRATRRTN